MIESSFNSVNLSAMLMLEILRNFKRAESNAAKEKAASVVYKKASRTLRPQGLCIKLAEKVGFEPT